MNSPVQLTDWIWYALTLQERALISQKTNTLLLNDANEDGGRGFNFETDAKVGRWCVRFRKLPEVAQKFILSRTGLNESDLARLVVAPPAQVSRCKLVPIPWLTILNEVFALDSTDEDSSVTNESFSVFVRPFVKWAVGRLNDKLSTLTVKITDDPALETSILQRDFTLELTRKLTWMCQRVLVLELNVARLDGTLHGSSSQDRYKSFVSRLRTADFRQKLLREYPVLARQLCEYMSIWLQVSSEFAERLYTDWLQLKKIFPALQDAGKIKSLSIGAGDPHRFGRTVTIISFESGTRIVYKPRSLSLDIHFQELLTWLNESGVSPSLRTISIWDRNEYGWSEFVDCKPCLSIDEVKRFYRRQGSYLAILYALEAVDFHAQNIIAFGEYPVLVDLEGLFHPRVRSTHQTTPEYLGQLEFYQSVMRVGLLPQYIHVSRESEGLDITGLGGEPGQVNPFPNSVLENIGTEEMQYVSKSVTFYGAQNRPTLMGESVKTQDYMEEILSGFSNLYRFFMKQKESQLKCEGALARFACDETRVVLRGTRVYQQFLNTSNHPDLLRDMSETEAHFQGLWTLDPGLADHAVCIESEETALMRGDIPIFTTSPHSCDLWTGDRRLINNFLEEPVFATVRCQLEKLTENDLRQQRWFIQSALIIPSISDGVLHKQGLHPTNPRTAPSRSELIGEACKVAEHLSEIALVGEGGMSWIGLSLFNDRQWALQPIGIDFYSGLSGPAFFFSFLGLIKNDERYTTMARQVVQTLQLRYDKLRELQLLPNSIGAFSGLGSYVYVLSHLGALWNDSALLNAAERAVDDLDAFVTRDSRLDIISGCAGCIVALATLDVVRPSAHVKKTIQRCADHIIETAIPIGDGCAWQTTVEAYQPLTGFSHGTAGIAFSLMEAYINSQRSEYRNRALQALAYERSTFSSVEENWPDFRRADVKPNGGPANGKPTYPALWCHGAAGIGLSRALMLRYLNESQLSDEISIATRTVLKRGFGRNHSLCHGDAGNLEVLLCISKITGDKVLRDKTYKIAGRLLDGIERHGWLCGTPNWVETPGMMMGLAGIGYSLLRLAEPDRIPSVLAIEKPAAEFVPSSSRHHRSAAKGFSN